MKTSFQSIAIRVLSAAVFWAASASSLPAQHMDPAFGPARHGMGAALPVALDGPVWLRYTPVPDGLGYDSSYTTLGALIPIWNTSGDAIWFVETQGHISGEGRFFGNFGFGRRIYEAGLRRTFGLSLWFDHDGDRYETFGHDFQQGGVTFDSFGDVLDIHINGYFPFQEGYTLGPSSPGFFQNNVMLLQGIDSPLRGTDVEAGVRLPWVPALDPRAYIGGYYYDSSSVDPFLGWSTRLEVQPTDFSTAQVRVTDDERFGTTAMVSMELHLGGRKHRPAFERITEPVHRNDHIVRFHQNPVFAINPNTGLPYRVVHVDANAASTGFGTFESPFTTLAQAQAGSIPHDIIYVYGDATYGGGIVLQDFQRLIGTGTPLVLRNGFLTTVSAPDIVEVTTVTVNGIPRLVRRFVNNVNSANFINNPQFNTTGLPAVTLGATGQIVLDSTGAVQTVSDFGVISNADTFQDGDILIADFPRSNPTLTNPAGAAVTLANFNEVANLNIVSSRFGIFGNGVTNFNIHDNTISSAPVSGDGIVVENMSGAGVVRNNIVTNNTRPNPPRTPDEPYRDGLRLSVSGASNADVLVIGNIFNDNDTGVRVTTTTSGVATFDFVDNITNSNVNDGYNIRGAGPGTLNVRLLSTGNVVDALTGLTPTITGPTPGSTIPIIIPAGQSSLNGDITKLTDTNGNGRGFFADVLDGRFNLAINNFTLLNNDSSFFPRYGAIQLNLEPEVDGANVLLAGNTIQGTGLFGTSPALVTPVPDGFIGAGSAIRIVTNPGLGVTHAFNIRNNTITENYSAGIELLMLTEGLRTAQIPQGTVVASVVGNTINNNLGIIDEAGQSLFGGLANSAGTGFINDFDSPGNLAPFPIGLLSNPDLKNEFFDNFHGSGLIVRAKGTDDSRLFLDILDNTFSNNWFDSINIALAGRGNIDFVPSPTPPPPGVVPPVPLTPVRVYEPVLRDGTNFPIASILSPDTFGVDATIVIDNNSITTAFDDAIKIKLLDGSRAQVRVSNNVLLAGDTFPTLPVLPPNVDLLSGRPSIYIPLNSAGAPGPGVPYDSALKIDTWDTSRIAVVIDNNDIGATPPTLATATSPHWAGSGIHIGSHENSVVATRITRNRVNEVLDQNTDYSDVFTLRPTPLSGAAINLLAEGNSIMAAFVNDNDLESRIQVSDTISPSTGIVATDAYFEATSADNAALYLQLLDNNAEQGNSPQLSHTLNLSNDAFYLVQTENSVFEIEPTRGTNHERLLPEILSIQTAVLAWAGPGPALPPSNMVQYGNVPSGNTETRVRELQAFGFPFDLGFPGLFNFDPPVIHP